MRAHSHVFAVYFDIDYCISLAHFVDILPLRHFSIQLISGTQMQHCVESL
jgi:hypothetical protein